MAIWRSVGRFACLPAQKRPVVRICSRLFSSISPGFFRVSSATKLRPKTPRTASQQREDNAPAHQGRPPPAGHLRHPVQQRLERRRHRIGAGHLRQVLKERARVQRQRMRHIARAPLRPPPQSLPRPPRQPEPGSRELFDRGRAGSDSDLGFRASDFPLGPGAGKSSSLARPSPVIQIRSSPRAGRVPSFSAALISVARSCSQ